jgi:hypothetical protein
VNDVVTPIDWHRRGGLLVPSAVTDATPDQDTAPESDDELEAPLDGYTGRVRALEARAAEADRLRALPTGRVLARHQELAEERELAALGTEAHASRLRDRGNRERAAMEAKAGSAAARRRLESNVAVRALKLGQRRRSRTLILWGVLLAAMAYTAVNVQKFAAGHAPAWDAQWIVGWFVDPVLSALVIALLLTRGDLAAYGKPAGESKWDRRIVPLVEIGALLAALLMNVAPTIADHSPWETVALHIVIPLAAVAAALALPIVQRRYADAIASLYADPSEASPAPINLPERAAEPAATDDLSPEDRKVLEAVRTALDAGDLEPAPSGYAIYRRVMGGKGDKARAYRVAAALQSYRPVIKAVS